MSEFILVGVIGAGLFQLYCLRELRRSEKRMAELKRDVEGDLAQLQQLSDELCAAAPITCPHCGKLTTEQSVWSEADDAAEGVAMLRRRPNTDGRAA